MKVVVVGLVSFLLLEALLLVFPDVFFPDRFYVYDSDLGFRVRPQARYGNAQANEFGFNDRDYPLRPAPGVFRILVLSDSFNWMGGPHSNYTHLLEEEFEPHYGKKRVEVIAAGYPMTHTAEQLALLKKFGLLYQPDLVVLGFYAGNDFLDGKPQRRRIAFGGTFVDYDIEEDYFLEILGQPVLWRSRLFAFLNEKYVVWRSRQHVQDEWEAAEASGDDLGFDDEGPRAARSAGVSAEAPAGPDYKAVDTVQGAQREMGKTESLKTEPLKPEKEKGETAKRQTEKTGATELAKAKMPKSETEKTEIETVTTTAAKTGLVETGADQGGSSPPRMAHSEYLRLMHGQIQFADRKRSAIFQPFVDYILGSLGEMKDLLEERGIALVVVAYPAEWQINEGLRRELLKRYDLPEDRFQWNRAQRLLAEFCRRQDIEYHDLTPAFRAARQRGRRLYLPDDSHWSLRGNQLAAERLLPVLSPHVEW